MTTLSRQSPAKQSSTSLPRRRIARHLLGYLRAVWLPFAVSLLLLFIIAALTASKAWVIQPVVDTFLRGRADLRGLYLVCGLAIGIFVSQAVCNWLYAVVARIASARVVRDIRRDLFRHLTRQSLAYFGTRPSGELASRVVNDVATFEFAAVGAVQMLLRDLATVLMLLGMLLLKEWRLALTCIGIVVVVGAVLRIMSRRIERVSRRVQEMVGQINHQLIELIGGIDLVIGFGFVGRWNRRFKGFNQAHHDAQLRSTRATSFTVLVVSIIVGLTVSGILFVTGRAVLAGRISAGDFGTFLAAMYLMQAPALTISNSVAKLAKGTAAAGRAFQLLEEDPQIKDPMSPRQLPEGPQPVEFVDVSFGYQSSLPVVRDLSFRVAPGELVVMVGDSGAGKSTIARLLMRFYDPDGGEITIGSVPIHAVRRADLYRTVAYVSQEIYLFDETIGFNLKIGRPDATDDEVADALRVACLEDLVETLPLGMETPVGERGARLSGGQRQRVAIARAVLTQCPILVLDEATSALDMELERDILQHLVNLAPSRTIFAVTHRLSLAEIADRVLVLRDGYLVEDGPAEELSRRGGEFARLRSAADSRLQRERVKA